MRRQDRSYLIRGGLLAATLFSVVASIFAGSQLPNPLHSSDPTGTLGTYSTAGGIDQSNPKSGDKWPHLWILPRLQRCMDSHSKLAAP